MRAISLFIGTVLGAALASADSSAAWSAADDLKVLAGTWQLRSAIGKEATQPFASLGNESRSFTVAGNQLKMDDGSPAIAIANDLNLPALQAGFAGAVANQGHLVLFTLASGQGVLASYELTKDLLTLRSPAGACSRSGTVLQFGRLKVTPEVTAAPK